MVGKAMASLATEADSGRCVIPKMDYSYVRGCEVGFSIE